MSRYLPQSTPAALLLAAALFVSAAGGAVAGGRITGAQIKDATITSVDVKDASLRTRDLTPVARAQLSYNRPAVKLPNGYGNEYSSGQSFFDRLFGNPVRQEPPAQVKQRRAQRTVTTR